MPRLELNSPACPECRGRGDHARAARTCHARGEALPRHKHVEPFLAIVLSGRYVEAGDTGRHVVGPGDVIAHEAYESHLDLFQDGPIEVLVLPCHSGCNLPVLARLPDPDAVVRLAERDIHQAYELTCQSLIARAPVIDNWPDALAAALALRPDICLREWATSYGLHPGSLGRGFRQVYGLTPARYRAAAKIRHALREVCFKPARLCDVAAASGFADQAHLTRSFRNLTGRTPAEFRRSLG